MVLYVVCEVDDTGKSSDVAPEVEHPDNINDGKLVQIRRKIKPDDTRLDRRDSEPNNLDT